MMNKQHRFILEENYKDSFEVNDLVVLTTALDEFRETGVFDNKTKTYFVDTKYAVIACKIFSKLKVLLKDEPNEFSISAYINSYSFTISVTAEGFYLNPKTLWFINKIIDDVGEINIRPESETEIVLSMQVHDVLVEMPENINTNHKKETVDMFDNFDFDPLDPSDPLAYMIYEEVTKDDDDDVDEDW